MYDEILTVSDSIVISVFVMAIILLALYIITLILEGIAKVITYKEAKKLASLQTKKQESADENTDELEAVIIAAAIAMMDGSDRIESIRFKEIGK